MKHVLAEALGPEFEVMKLVGKGKQAEVYLAREIPLDRLVAVKVLLSTLVDDDVAKARFEREAKAVASLNHPNAASVFRSGLLPNGAPFLVLQYVRGKTLEARIEGEGPLPAAEARQVLHGVAAALAAAHDRGFLHRDVRPANVLCDAQTGKSILTDFGVAGIIPTGGSDASRLTQTGEFLGDIDHLSPEVLSGEDASEASDVYALGVMGYETLTGRGPFSQLPLSGRIAAQRNAAPPSLSTLLDTHDPELERVLEQCLATRPDRRPTARFVAEVLGSEPGTGPATWRATRGSGEGGVLTSLMTRRFPQILVAAAGAGWVALEGVSQLVDMGVVGSLWYRLALTTVVCGVLAAAVVAWFHGAKGRQRTGAVEITLLAILGVVWLLLTVSIALPG